VVATIDAPASHHGTARPDMKYSVRLSPPFFVKAKPMPADRRKYAATMAQSIGLMCIGSSVRGRAEPVELGDNRIRQLTTNFADLVVVPRRIDAVAQQDDEQVARRVNRDGRAGESRVAERARRHQVSRPRRRWTRELHPREIRLLPADP